LGVNVLEHEEGPAPWSVHVGGENDPGRVLEKLTCPVAGYRESKLVTVAVQRVDFPS
jgi:hypothetical protein